MNKYMEIADELAKDNLKTKVGGPFGACIVKNGKVVGRGSNHVIQNNDPTAHAEVMAIRDACSNLNTYDLSGCKIYTSCYPCPMCMSAIIWSNMKDVYYGNTREDAGNIGFRDDYIYNFIENYCSDKDTLKIKGIDREETIKTFDEYAKKRNKTKY